MFRLSNGLTIELEPPDPCMSEALPQTDHQCFVLQQHVFDHSDNEGDTRIDVSSEYHEVVVLV